VLLERPQPKRGDVFQGIPPDGHEGVHREVHKVCASGKHIFTTTKISQYSVIGSPPATGKTSLLQLLKKALEDKGSKGIRVNVRDIGLEKLTSKLADLGIEDNEQKLREQLNKDTWVLFDDAQNAYAPEYAPFWQFVQKGLLSYDLKNLFVVIAALTNSPISFQAMEHIEGINITKDEARENFKMHAEVWGYEDWKSLKAWRAAALCGIDLLK